MYLIFMTSVATTSGISAVNQLLLQLLRQWLLQRSQLVFIVYKRTQRSCVIRIATDWVITLLTASAHGPRVDRIIRCGLSERADEQ